MDELPWALEKGRHVDLVGRTPGPWIRRALLVVLLALPVLALLNAFGQDETKSVAAAPAATLQVTAPDHMRGGLFFTGRIDVTARRHIEHPTLELGPAWAEEMQLNSIEPNPSQETSRNGRILLSYDALDAGERLTVWLPYEVNPTAAGDRDAAVVLRDGQTPLARVDRRMIVFP